MGLGEGKQLIEQILIRGKLGMDELKVINEQEVLGKQFKMYGDFENPLFLAKDVAEWLEYSKTSEGYYNVSKMLMTIEEEDKLTITNSNSGGKSSFLTEDGLYEVLMQSRKPIAKQFKKEVKEILKTIRKHGLYAIDQLLDDPKFMIKAFTALKEERSKNKELKNELSVKDQQIAELNPKASYYDVVLQTKDTLAISIIAKDYGKSARWMNGRLHEKGIQFKQGSVWLLYQKYAEQGYTKTKTDVFSDSNGAQHSRPHTYWTQKGRLFIYDLLKSDGVLPLMELENNIKAS